MGLPGYLAQAGKDPAFEVETEQFGPEFDRFDVPGRAAYVPGTVFRTRPRSGPLAASLTLRRVIPV
jgi:hypothetical protein